MFCVLERGSFSQERAINGGKLGGREIGAFCCFNSVHFSCSLFSSLAESKKVGNQRDPNQDHKCGLICCVLVPCQSSGCSDCTRLSLACAQLSCSPRGPRKQNPQSNTTRARLFLNSQRWGPALHRFTSHNTTFTQPNSFCGFCPSQNTLVQSPNVFLAWPDSDRLSIMTFSEIGPGSLKCNAFDRCLSLQLHKSRYTE